MTSRRRALHGLGQSVWPDDIRCQYMEDRTPIERVQPRPRLHRALNQVEHTRRQFNLLSIDFEAVADRLECARAAKFIEAYDRLLSRLQSRRQTVLGHTGAFGS